MSTPGSEDTHGVEADVPLSSACRLPSARDFPGVAQWFVSPNLHTLRWPPLGHTANRCVCSDLFLHRVVADARRGVPHAARGAHVLGRANDVLPARERDGGNCTGEGLGAVTVTNANQS